MTPEVTKRIMDRIAKYLDMSNKRIADGIRVDGVRVSTASVASVRSGEPLGKNVEYKKAGVKTLSIEDVVAPHDKVGEALSKIKSIPAGQLMDDETLRYHRTCRLPIVAYSSQAGGFFAGNYDPAGPPPGVTPNPNIVRYYGTDENYARLALAKKLASQKGCSPNQIALAYLLNQSFPTFAIVGANTPERVADSCRAADVILTEAEVRLLESPPPIGSTP